jgi:hypothetical protein
MIEILQNTQATLSVTFSGGDADGAVTVTITDGDGTVIVNAANAAHSGSAGSGTYTYPLPPQADLKWLTVTWTGSFGGVQQSISTNGGQPDGTASEVQVAGGHLFTIAELRAYHDKILSDPTKYPDAVLIDARSRATILFEDFCNVAFVPRYARVVLDGNWTRSLWLPHLKVNKVRAITINGVALSAGDLAQVAVYPYGKLDRIGLWPPYMQRQNIVVSYEHGFLSVPEDIARSGMALARYDFVINQLSDRFISYQNDLGVIRQAIPDEEHPTGIPIIDSTLRRYRLKTSGETRDF